MTSPRDRLLDDIHRQALTRHHLDRPGLADRLIESGQVVEDVGTGYLMPSETAQDDYHQRLQTAPRITGPETVEDDIEAGRLVVDEATGMIEDA